MEFPLHLQGGRPKVYNLRAGLADGEHYDPYTYSTFRRSERDARASPMRHQQQRLTGLSGSGDWSLHASASSRVPSRAKSAGAGGRGRGPSSTVHMKNAEGKQLALNAAGGTAAMAENGTVMSRFVSPPRFALAPPANAHARPHSHANRVASPQSPLRGGDDNNGGGFASLPLGATGRSAYPMGIASSGHGSGGSTGFVATAAPRDDGEAVAHAAAAAGASAWGALVAGCAVEGLELADVAALQWASVAALASAWGLALSPPERARLELSWRDHSDRLWAAEAAASALHDGDDLECALIAGAITAEGISCADPTDADHPSMMIAASSAAAVGNRSVSSVEACDDLVGVTPQRRSVLMPMLPTMPVGPREWAAAGAIVKGSLEILFPSAVADPERGIVLLRVPPELLPPALPQ